MLTTAKSIQLLDTSGMNISPITDITSLYYETYVNYHQDNNDTSIVTRKYIYAGFPLSVNISTYINDPSCSSNASDGLRTPELWQNGDLYKLQNEKGEDIIVSNVSTEIIPGTTYRQLNVENYNLSNILSHYTPLNLMDSSIEYLNSSIIYINNFIEDISTKIENISIGLYTESTTLENLMQRGAEGNLVPNKFYLINDYYDGGCMLVPSNGNFNGPDNNSSLSLLVKANDASTLDGKLYEMYDHSGNALKVYGTYKLEDNNTKVHITYMKDQYGNEAPYDFYNLKYNGKYTYNYTNLNNLIINPGYIKNNIIKTDPYTFFNMHIIDTSVNSNNQILNNYFGYDSSISVGDCMLNNFIGNNVTLLDSKGSTKFINNRIYNNNNINIEDIITHRHTNILKNAIIKSDNNIIFTNHYEGTTTFTFNLNNLIINSSNNITISGGTISGNEVYASNITILNNCNGSINLSDNIIVDNYISADILQTSPNSVYLFGQDVYAKSFNTLN